MTGAQQSALERLHRRKEKFQVKSQPRRGDIRVEWSKRNPWGGFTSVKARVTEQGLVIND